MKAKYDSRFLDIIFIQLFIILLFSGIYYSILHHFTSTMPGYVMGYLDCLSLSTTIQAGIGLTSMQASSNTSVIITTIHQALVIISGAYILFTFTIDA